MRREEMSATQLAKRTLFVSKLLDAGWDPRGWEILFESGMQLTPEAQAEFKSRTANLRLAYYIEDECVALECAGRADPSPLALRFYPKLNISAFLDLVIDRQHSLSPDDYLELVSKANELCEHIFLRTPQGLLRLSSPSP